MALPGFLAVLGEVVKLEIEWTITDDPNHYWLQVVPDCRRPWFKVDIGIDPWNDGQPAHLG